METANVDIAKVASLKAGEILAIVGNPNGYPVEVPWNLHAGYGEPKTIPAGKTWNVSPSGDCADANGNLNGKAARVWAIMAALADDTENLVVEVLDRPDVFGSDASREAWQKVASACQGKATEMEAAGRALTFARAESVGQAVAAENTHAAGNVRGVLDSLETDRERDAHASRVDKWNATARQAVEARVKAGERLAKSEAVANVTHAAVEAQREGDRQGEANAVKRVQAIAHVLPDALARQAVRQGIERVEADADDMRGIMEAMPGE